MTQTEATRYMADDGVSSEDLSRDDASHENIWNEDALNEDVWREGVWNGWQDVSELPKPTPPELVQHISLARKYLTPDKADAFEAALRRIHARAKHWEADDRKPGAPDKADQPHM